MADSIGPEKALLGELIALASAHAEQLSESDDFMKVRREWYQEANDLIHERLGDNDHEFMNFNNPDNTGVIGEIPKPSDALEFTRKQFEQDIQNFRTYRMALGSSPP